MSTFQVTLATREASPVFASIVGESGSGKTYSALLIARGLVGPDGKIVVIDTEGKRSLIYADDATIGGFQHIDFAAPYSSDRYREAMQAAIEAGADAIVIDSTSHEWEGEGGVLHFAEEEEERLGNTRGKHISKWIKPKAKHQRFLNAALAAPCHVLFCYREKSSVDDQGKEQIKAVTGKKDIYEMLFSISLSAEAPGKVASFNKILPKPMAGLVGVGELLSIETGKRLAGDIAKQPAPTVAKTETVSSQQDDEARAELVMQVTEFLADNDVADDALTGLLKRKSPDLTDWRSASNKALDYILKNPDAALGQLS